MYYIHWTEYPTEKRRRSWVGMYVPLGAAGAALGYARGIEKKLDLLREVDRMRRAPSMRVYGLARKIFRRLPDPEVPLRALEERAQRYPRRLGAIGLGLGIGTWILGEALDRVFD